MARAVRQVVERRRADDEIHFATNVARHHSPQSSGI
jgi:hypothetical protein